TKSLTVFYLKNEEGKKELILDQNNAEDDKDIFKEKLEKSVEDITNKSLFSLEIDKRSFVVVPVFCQCQVHGYLGAEDKTSDNAVEGMKIADQLRFLSELTTISLEKFLLEKVNRDLVINEEQNRIANEIHDGVLQKLFAISCGVFGIKKNAAYLDTKKITDELTAIQESINDAMGDLRSTIYGYSWKKNGVNNFLNDIYKLIDRTKNFHGININFETKGNLELISAEYKKAFYRILSEGIGNAIRHGKASSMSIQLNIYKEDVFLKIHDDGIGFNPDVLKETKKQGLGIRNMKTLTESLNGDLQILSEEGKGTSINIEIPVKLQSHKEEFYESVGCR
ncbi:MAG: hypothetical protein GX957_07400, partial [Clostridiaceae bacterium]|nr:hypothetical protein [Clostridiaceae bacterium]